MKLLYLVAERATRHAERTILLLTLGCMAVFLASLAIPRGDNLLLSSDAPHYYAYLPSLVFDRDVDLSNQYAHLIYLTGATESPGVEAVPETPAAVWWEAHGLLFWRGYLPTNRNPVGTAILWMPFFVLAHLVATALSSLGFDVATDGYGNFYQAFVLLGSILYGGLGLVLVYRFARRLCNSGPALSATLLIAMAGNLVYYMTADPGMPHTASLFASGLLFYLWGRRGDGFGWKSAALLGFAGGLMALVRPQDGLMLAVPFLAAIPSVWRSLRARSGSGVLGRYVRDAAIAAVVSLAVFSPQVAIWGGLRVGIDYTPMAALEIPEPPEASLSTVSAEAPEQGVRFAWARPDLVSALFGAPRGLISWHPIFLLALLGLIPAALRAPPYAVAGAIGFLIQLYIVAVFYGQGESFGSRVFIVCTPVFALGLSHAVRVAERLSLASKTWLASALVLWNFLIYVSYRFEILLMPTEPDFYQITLGRVESVLRIIGVL